MFRHIFPFKAGNPNQPPAPHLVQPGVKRTDAQHNLASRPEAQGNEWIYGIAKAATENGAFDLSTSESPEFIGRVSTHCSTTGT